MARGMRSTLAFFAAFGAAVLGTRALVSEESPTTWPTVNPYTAWKVESGPCTADSSGCVLSPDHASPNSSTEERCEVFAVVAGPIRVAAFNASGENDTLTVNGIQYSGTTGPEGVVPTGLVVWAANGSVAESGWRLCLEAQSATCYASLGTSGHLNASKGLKGAHTVEAWVRTGGTSALGAPWFGNSFFTDKRWGLYLGTAKIYSAEFGGPIYRYLTPSPADGTWHHIAVAGTTFYVDGARSTTITQYLDRVSNMWIGNSPYAFNSSATGGGIDVRDFRVWSTIRTKEQLASSMYTVASAEPSLLTRLLFDGSASDASSANVVWDANGVSYVCEGGAALTPTPIGKVAVAGILMQFILEGMLDADAAWTQAHEGVIAEAAAEVLAVDPAIIEVEVAPAGNESAGVRLGLGEVWLWKVLLITDALGNGTVASEELQASLLGPGGLLRALATGAAAAGGPDLSRLASRAAGPPTLVKDYLVALPTWSLGPWRSCSTLCGKGEATRDANCSSSNAARCGRRPQLVQTCAEYSGCPHDWSCPGGPGATPGCTAQRALVSSAIGIAGLCAAVPFAIWLRMKFRAPKRGTAPVRALKMQASFTVVDPPKEAQRGDSGTLSDADGKIRIIWEMQGKSMEDVSKLLRAPTLLAEGADDKSVSPSFSGRIYENGQETIEHQNGPQGCDAADDTVSITVNPERQPRNGSREHILRHRCYRDGERVEYYSETHHCWMYGRIYQLVGVADEGLDVYDLKVGTRGGQFRRAVSLDFLRLPLAAGEPVDVFVPRGGGGGGGGGGAWRPGSVHGPQPSSWATLGHRVLLEGASEEDTVCVPAVRLRRRFPSGVPVSVYRGRARGWAEALPEERLPRHLSSGSLASKDGRALPAGVAEASPQARREVPRAPVASFDGQKDAKQDVRGGSGELQLPKLSRSGTVASTQALDGEALDCEAAMERWESLAVKWSSGAGAEAETVPSYCVRRFAQEVRREEGGGPDPVEFKDIKFCVG